MYQDLVDRHRAVFGSAREDVQVVSAPCRICPIGAHVDHQLGLVTGLALDAGVHLAYTPNRGGLFRLRSLNFPGQVDFGLAGIPPMVPGDWGNYARGAALALRREHEIRNGIDGIITGDLPIGGLSSSAAAGVCYLLALERANGLELSSAENIVLDQCIENQYIGLDNGVLDQSVILLSRKEQLLWLDCKSGEYENVRFAPEAPPAEIGIVYSGLSRSLVNTEYNRRVAECKEAARELLRLAGLSAGETAVLRQVPEEVFEAHLDALPAKLRKRATHYFEECRRVPRAVDAWRRGDLPEFGSLMNQSGESSIGNYECGDPHLITLYRLLAGTPGVHGARFSGGGFRGCCVALVGTNARDEIASKVFERYPREHPDTADAFSVHFCGTADGAGWL